MVKAAGKGKTSVRPSPYDFVTQVKQETRLKEESGTKKCFCCGGDHTKAECPVRYTAVCSTCGKQGHTDATCEQGCYVCGGDHQKIDCPIKDTAECSTCGKKGHLDVTCGRDFLEECFACGGNHKKVDCPNLDKTCDLCGRVGHLKWKCESKGKGFGKGAFAKGGATQGCFACGGDHQKAQCPNLGKTCDNCGKVGHLKFMCEAFGKGVAGKGGKGSMTCFACGGNHQKAQCPNLWKTCDLCGKVGHMKAMCELGKGSKGSGSGGIVFGSKGGSKRDHP